MTIQTLDIGTAREVRAPRGSSGASGSRPASSSGSRLLRGRDRLWRMLSPEKRMPCAPSSNRSLKAIPIAFDGKYCHQSVEEPISSPQRAPLLETVLGRGGPR